MSETTKAAASLKAAIAACKKNISNGKDTEERLKELKGMLKKEEDKK